MARTRKSVRLKMAWSPLPSDPRFSRTTPDEVLARIEAKRSVGPSKRCMLSSWASHILHVKACKTDRRGRKRAQLLSLLERMAEAAEAVPSPKAPASDVVPESCLNSVVRPETATENPKHRSVL